jgi:maleamate amidohydrolase
MPGLDVFREDSPLARLVPGLRAPRETLLTKQYPSAFFGTALADMLHATSIDTLLIAGVTTSGCVRATAVDSLCHGFVPIVVTDAVADRQFTPHRANLFDLDAKYALLATVDESIRNLAI